MKEFACCTSSIGPRCGHTIGGQSVTLARLARESITIALVNGVRPNDPLVALVTAETWRDWHAAAELATGKRIEVSRGVDMAARLRAAVRRVAILAEVTR